MQKLGSTVFSNLTKTFVIAVRKRKSIKNKINNRSCSQHTDVKGSGAEVVLSHQSLSVKRVFQT